MLYTAPSGAVQVLLLWIGVAGCWMFPRNRTLVVVALIIPPLVGTVLLLKLSTESGWGMIVASWLVSDTDLGTERFKQAADSEREQASCITAVMSPLLSLTASNVKGNTKRSVVSAMFFIGYCAGCIGAPQLWTEKPRYFKGVVTGIVTWCLLLLVVVAYRYVCMRDNAARDKPSAANEGQEDPVSQDQVVLDKYGSPRTDLTDKEDTKFRYSF